VRRLKELEAKSKTGLITFDEGLFNELALSEDRPYHLVIFGSAQRLMDHPKVQLAKLKQEYLYAAKARGRGRWGWGAWGAGRRREGGGRPRRGGLPTQTSALKPPSTPTPTPTPDKNQPPGLQVGPRRRQGVLCGHVV
jgi:hypothetical protein